MSTRAARGTASDAQSLIQRGCLLRDGLFIVPFVRFDVAVFPIANAVLFPGVTLPLHIYEKRYEQMLRDVQAKGWPLAISLVTPRDSEAQDEFVLNRVCGVGEVQVNRTYPDGRTDVLVHGQRRVRLCSFIQQEPYILMEAEAYDPDPGAPGASLRELIEFRALLKTWAFINPDVPDELGVLLDEYTDVGPLSDFFAFHFIRKATDQQIYLDVVNPLQRTEMLTRFLETDLVRLTKKVAKLKRKILLH